MRLFYTILLNLIVLTASISSAAQASVVHVYSKGYSDALYIHYAIFKSDTQETVGDVLYFHGYGDTLENHVRLFREMTDAGIRVIAFDLPSHGKTQGRVWDDLDCFSFTDLTRLAAVIERETLEDSSRPLILSGWSTGGLIALRIAQSNPLSTFTRYPGGMVLFAPAVSVPVCVGDALCQITNETLTHDATLFQRQASPPTPLMRVNFAAKLLYNASLSWNAVSSDIPLLVWVAGNSEDRYVNTPQVKTWVASQRESGHGFIAAIQCAKARHELDNETDAFGGKTVRAVSADFARRVFKQELDQFSYVGTSNCQGF